MAITLIGLHRAWGGPPLSPPQRDRFAASLGMVDGRPAQNSFDGDTLLAATGQQRGWRPQIAADGSRILFAGHIDNRRQLASELAMAPASDAALYAAGYAAWGDAIDLKAIGQFAAIITHPDRHEVRLARSPIAAPPLLYWHRQDRLIIASLVNAIFATGEAKQQVDEQKVADSLFLSLNETSRTWHIGVSRLDCGHRALITQNGVTVESYYDVGALPAVRFKDERDYVAAGKELLEEGVRAALDGFSRPAISLSGGYDSQAVAALVAQHRQGQPLEAFTGVPEAEWDGITYASVFGDERPYVEALAAMYPEIRPHWVDAQGKFLDHKLSSIFLLAGEAPGHAANLHWIHEAYEQARATGCDVMLNGGFGNASFSFDGDGALATMARRGQWLRLWKEAKFFSPEHANSRFRAIASRALLPFAPDWLHSCLVRSGLIKINEPFGTWCPLNRDYAEKMQLAHRARLMGYDPFHRRPFSTRQWRDEMVNFSGAGAEMGQAIDLIHGIETRDPTSYRPLVELCLGIPDDQYLRDGEARRLARRMLKGVIPDGVLDETRSGTQAADWHLRLGRQRTSLIAEIDRLATDESISSMLNLQAMRQALVDWPESSLGANTLRLKLAVTRGLTTARYIRFVKGNNE